MSLDDFPWPPEIPVLGPMRGGQPFGRCIFHVKDKDPAKDTHPAIAGTFVKYGDDYVCLACAIALTREAGAEVEEMLARARRVA